MNMKTTGGATCRDTNEVPCRQQDNAERLHDALKGLQRILTEQQDLIARLAKEDRPDAVRDSTEKNYTPSLQVLLSEAPNEIASITDQAVNQVQTMHRMLYGEG